MIHDPFYATTDEMALVGACLIGTNETAHDVLAAITTGLIQHEIAEQTLAVIRSLADRNEPCRTPDVVREWPKIHRMLPIPMDFLINCEGAIPSEANFPYHLAAAKEAHQRRTLRLASQNLALNAKDPTKRIEEAIAELETVLSPHERANPDIESAKTVSKRFIDKLHARFLTRGTLSGVPTGITRLDKLTDGIQYGEVFVVGARPSIGKTAFGGTLAYHAAIVHGIPTLFVTMEMSSTALMQRMTSVTGSVSISAMTRGEMSEQEFRNIQTTQAKINASPLHFLDYSSGANISHVVAGMRRAVRKHGIKLVIIDYLQKIHGTGRHEKFTYELQEVSGKIKGFAASTGTAVVLLAQLNREQEKEKDRPPRLADLADSKAIEQDADVVALLHRKRSEPSGEAQIIIAKSRNGECGLVKSWYTGDFCRFDEPRSSVDSDVR